MADRLSCQASGKKKIGLTFNPFVSLAQIAMQDFCSNLVDFKSAS